MASMLNKHAVKSLQLFSACKTNIHVQLQNINLSVKFCRFQSTAPSAEQHKGALDGIKILDLSRVLAAPFCTQILADYGADVIKVESIGKGDDTRHWKSKSETQAWDPKAGPLSSYFTAVNRNKRSICLDLKDKRGRDIFLELVKNADVVVDNFRPGAMDRLGLDYNTLANANPRIIQASISGYGTVGPYAKRAGYDMIAGAEAGMLHLTGERGGPPVRPGLGLTDMSTGLYAHGAIIAALFRRQQTGRGQHINASLFESQVALLTNVATSWLNMGEEAERWGTQHPTVVPYDAFKTQDLYFVCGATNDRQFQTLCNVLGLEDLPKDDRFLTNEDRVKNRDALYPLLNAVFESKSTDEWLGAFEGSGLPYAPINNMERVFAHPQTEATDMVRRIPYEPATSGSLHILGPAVKFSESATSIRRAPPLLGQHTVEVLEEAGVPRSDIDCLRQEKVIN